jgi:hypothetical protein
MSSLTATLLKKLIASSDADRKEIERAVELHPTETEDQLLNIRSLLSSFTSHGEALRSALREFE